MDSWIARRIAKQRYLDCLLSSVTDALLENSQSLLDWVAIYESLLDAAPPPSFWRAFRLGHSPIEVAEMVEILVKRRLSFEDFCKVWAASPCVRKAREELSRMGPPSSTRGLDCDVFPA